MLMSTLDTHLSRLHTFSDRGQLNFEHLQDDRFSHLAIDTHLIVDHFHADLTQVGETSRHETQEDARISGVGVLLQWADDRSAVEIQVEDSRKEVATLRSAHWAFRVVDHVKM